jgi:hypothetical protein
MTKVSVREAGIFTDMANIYNSQIRLMGIAM